MVANAMSSGTLNHKLDSLLFTYSMALDFLPRHLEPGPSLTLRTGLRPKHPSPPPRSQHMEGDIIRLGLTISGSHTTSDWGIRKGITWIDAQTV
jgi:hypothetical protein